LLNVSIAYFEGFLAFAYHTMTGWYTSVNFHWLSLHILLILSFVQNFFKHILPVMV
jgi:hypothetical protein